MLEVVCLVINHQCLWRLDGKVVEVSVRLEPYMKPFSDSGKFQRNDQLRDDQTQQHIWLGATKRIAACLISEIQVTEENGNKEWVFQSKKYHVIDSELVNSLRSFGYTTNLSAGFVTSSSPTCYGVWSME